MIANVGLVVGGYLYRSEYLREQRRAFCLKALRDIDKDAERKSRDLERIVKQLSAVVTSRDRDEWVLAVLPNARKALAQAQLELELHQQEVEKNRGAVMRALRE